MVITKYIPQIKSFQAKVELLFGRLDEDEFMSLPNKGGWSIQQCIQHLTISGNLYADQIQDVLENNSEFTNSTCTHRKFQRFIIWLIEPTYHLPLKAPKSFKPASQNNQASESPDQTINSFTELQNRFIHQIQSVHNQNKNGMIVRSPLSRWLKFNMCELFGMICAHERRHIWQAETTLQAIRKKHSKSY